MLPILENSFFFQRSGVEAWTLRGSCCLQAALGRQLVSLLPVLSAACQTCAESRCGAAVQIESALWPLATPSSPSVAVRRCPWPTRTQQITGQGGARAGFWECPAFRGHMACSPQMGNCLSIKRFGLISWNLLLAAHFQSLEQWRSDRLPRQRTAFSEGFTAASSLVNWWSRVYLGLRKRSCCPAFCCGESFCLGSNWWN